MKGKSVIIVVLALLATISVATAAFMSLWQRQPTFLVTNQQYTALLVNPDANIIGVPGASETVVWTRMDQHHYAVSIEVLATYQVVTGSLTVNVTDIPSFLNVTCSSIEIWRIYPTGSSPPFAYEVTSVLATAPAFDTVINFDPLAVYWDTGIEKPGTGITYKRCITIILEEYQIGPSELTSEVLHTTISLGVTT
jgi:hypothetical protein